MTTQHPHPPYGFVISVHTSWNENVVILTKSTSLAAMEVVNNDNFVKSTTVPFHWNGTVVILTKFSSLVEPNIAISTTSGAASDEDFVKMTIFPFQRSGAASVGNFVGLTFPFQCMNDVKWMNQSIMLKKNWFTYLKRNQQSHVYSVKISMAWCKDCSNSSALAMEYYSLALSYRYIRLDKESISW